ncbi:MAG: 5-dehydro-2-deoxygluconokinase [Chloroflexota bacterium]|nr:5-dehydro-2-deoxygluconokinase [Chloroflexota bacterium]
MKAGEPWAPEAVVLGRLHADLYPEQIGLRLEDVQTFRRFVGGFAGNVGVGLARLGVPTAVISSVGDDGHGRFIRRFLEDEGIDTRWVSTHPSARTPLTFCEIRPPADFPLLAYRPPDAPDWQLTPDLILLDVVLGAPILFVSGTAFAFEPSRSTTLGVMARRRQAGPGSTVLDLDWRAGYWPDAADYGPQMREAASFADVLIGSDEEFRVAGLSPADAASSDVRNVFLKHGPKGASFLAGDRTEDVPGFPVEVVNGLGAGDAFAAAVGWGLLRGLDPREILRLANVAGAMVAERIECSGAMPTALELTARAGVA